MRIDRATLSRFLVVGLCGAGVDFLTFSVVFNLTESAHLSRATASFVAIFSTWIGNRYFTFERPKQKILCEVAKYYLTSLVGAAFNFFVFSFVLLLTRNIPFAYIGGTIAGLLVNYTGYNIFVFPKKSQRIRGSKNEN
ncbi:GtrA family protein [Salmonella enterica subsp. enterica serovar Alachua]|nr:GtrA family protein [Salmonella enterica subsp. enterica serovar Alachua]